MNSAFWRYILILSVLFIFWGQFFVTDGLLNQVSFNFALFYPLGFLVGYRPRLENLRSAYLAALLFNCLSYLAAVVSGIPIESWIVVGLDFLSLLVFLKVGMIIGQRAQSKN
ncbi:putative membrane protein [Candidatus Desulfosporosinus infrequens]|uniref:Putative membrane protein n=1 Tax=Candidatus Desulfosporosinus infrequens TaxID=2043169 RepID=A0A2U3LFN1_9FIRM|nr:putative membrane protein [Candidatus Desulfosporosinus infrequens]